MVALHKKKMQLGIVSVLKDTLEILWMEENVASASVMVKELNVIIQVENAFVQQKVN